ncbi:hypothetical protein F511_23212 [Dorcoceras hygrometricum]|uniref:Uncharacterized protein n=1 Tax=Dorcoceras hygrometricum TaxID=472368 RepID=A0A2Z7A7U6_9LAMI|nr:hypothetical protein F511_23212 [Dorcoceras hygrometricum]
MTTLLATRAWLRPVSRGNRHFTVDGGRLRQSGPRPDTRLLRQPALEALTRSARTDSPHQVGRNKFRRLEEAAAACLERRGAAPFASIGYPRMTASDESSTTMHRLLHASGSHPIPPPDDPNIGYPRIKASGESSTTKHRLLHASGPHPIPPPNDPK